jgi:hypothetical protein
MSFAGADAALQRLTHELASARDRLAVRTKAAEMAAAPLLARIAGGMAQEIGEHQRQIERLGGLLRGFDRDTSWSIPPPFRLRCASCSLPAAC